MNPLQPNLLPGDDPTPNPVEECMEAFLQEASEHLQFVREYCGILQDPYPAPDDLERLYIAAHTLRGTSATFGFPLFAEVAGKLAHIFQYASNVGITAEAAAPLLEFISEAVACLESDLLMISANSVEAAEEVSAFQQRYPFAFQAPLAEAQAELNEAPAAAAEPEFSPGAEHPDVSESASSAPALSEVGPSSALKPPVETPELPPDAEIPQEILEFFIPEAEEHLQTVTECLLALETNASADDVHRLFRAVHTIKGSAAQVGWQRIAHLAHHAEDLIGRLRDGHLQPSPEIIDLCLDAVDCLKKFLYRQWPDEAAAQSAAAALLARIAGVATPGVTSGPALCKDLAPGLTQVEGPQPEEQHVTPESAVAAELPDVPQPAIISHQSAKPAAAPQSKSVRIALDRLDRMMNVVGELVINRTRMLGRVAELERLAEVLNFSKKRMSEKIAEFQEKYEFNSVGWPAENKNERRSRARSSLPSLEEWVPETRHPKFGRRTADRSPFPTGWDLTDGSKAPQAREAGHFTDFSELEMDRYDEFNILSRSLTEISADVTEVLTQLDGFVRRVDSDIDEFTKLAHRLQDEITQARMVPIGNLYTRISRTARDAAKATGKQIELTLSGAETELDNNIIQQISDPLLHLVRNSVAHGIERAQERYNAGKPDNGNVAVRAYHRGNHIYIEVEDDGRGIDYQKVRATAVELGLLDSAQAEGLSEHQLQDLLFHPGFSTASRKTELAGRGVGLDVVRANLDTLNGEIEVETQKGVGTRFTLKVPLTLIISQALFVRCGTRIFAFPLAFVEEIRRLRATDIEEVGGKLLTKVRDVVTEVVRLDAQLGLPPVDPVSGFYRMVIVNVAGRQIGIVVEEVLRKDEIVIKNLGEYLRNVKLFPGATIAPDGSLILLVDVSRLVAGEAIERRPLMIYTPAARVFAPGAAAVAAGEIPKAASEPVPQEKVVVLADDSISVRKCVGRMLEKVGYRVKLAADGLEALELASQAHCDVVVTDLEMPRTNGYELMSHLRQNPETRDIPVLVVTSRAGAKHRERALSEGAAAFLVKPVQEDELTAAVAQLLEGDASAPKLTLVSGHDLSRAITK